MSDDRATDDSVHTLTGAYALDALTDEERASFVDHLAECDACAVETAALVATAARLSLLTEEPAPAHLRSAVLDQVSRTPQEPPLATPGLAPVVDLGARRRRRVFAGVGGALAAAAAVAGAVFLLGSDPDPVAEILAATDARTIVGEVDGGGEAELVVSESLDGGVITFAGLPDPGEGRAYQVWLVSGTTPPVPEDTFGPSEGGTASVLLEGAPTVDAVALTVEPEGGSDAPTTEPIAVIPLSG